MPDGRQELPHQTLPVPTAAGDSESRGAEFAELPYDQHRNRAHPSWRRSAAA
jgi:hypothetical protein